MMFIRQLVTCGLVAFLGVAHTILTQAQSLTFALYDSVPVHINNRQLPNAWAGGLNAPQFSTIDLNGDGTDDLFVFDRTNNKISTFLRLNNRYVYAPQYELLFPQGMLYWCLLADYDRDGRKDIFTTSDFGIRVFRNVTPPGGMLRFELARDPVQVTGITGNTFNLRIDITDIPALVDVDGDGDLDILNFIPISGFNIEWNKNMSQERFGRPDSLVFERANLRWGNVEECANCNEFLFGNEFCRTDAIEHAGSTMLITDLNADGLPDLIVGDVDCPNLVEMLNVGTLQNANFTAFNPSFPRNRPARFNLFPAAFMEDVDGDGIKDLLVSPNVFFNEGNLIDFTRSVWMYKNTGANNNPQFDFQQENFLQDDMIELGENTRPQLADIDGDGDLDLLVSTTGQRQGNENFRSRIYLFENTGSNARPAFRLVDDNFADLLSRNLRNLKISFADLDANGRPDLVFTATANTNNRSEIFWIPNLASGGERWRFNAADTRVINLDISLNDEALFYDLNGNGRPDLLLARFQGALLYYENTGNLTFELRNAQAGGIVNDLDRRGLSISIADINGDGRPDLITGDRRASINIYSDFISGLSGQLQAETLTVLNPLSNRPDNYHFGREVFPAVLGSDIIAGTNAGGLIYLKNKGAVTSLPPQNPALRYQQLKVWPNPTSDLLNLTPQTEAGTVELISITGAVRYRSQLPAQIQHTISVADLPQGAYIVRFTTRSGSVSQTIVSIIR
jgi:hypothetical protein